MSGNPYQHAPVGESPPGLAAIQGGGGIDKPRLLKEYAARYGCRSLVETGLFLGHGSGMSVPDVRYVAVDWQEENVELARGIGHEAYCGDSPCVVSDLLAGLLDGGPLPTPALFWLDAHALSEDEGAPRVCPVLGELAAITAWQHAAESVVLIDDVWGFGSLRGWPSLPELLEACERGPWRVSHDGAVVYCLPR